MKRNIAYIMATGPSINKITDEEWKFLETQQTLGISKFPITGKKTTAFYSHEGFKWQKGPLDLMAMNGYLDTVLLLDNKESIRYALKLGFKKIYRTVKQSALFLPSAKGWFMDEPEPPHRFSVCKAKNLNEPIFRFRGTLPAAINVVLILGATEIRLVGVDLDTYWAFWDVDDRWLTNDVAREIRDEVRENQIQSMEQFKKMTGMDNNNFHKTAVPYTRKDGWVAGRMIRPVQDVVQWIDKEIRKEGMQGIFVTNKESLLNKEKKIEYKGIMDS